MTQVFLHSRILFPKLPLFSSSCHLCMSNDVLITCGVSINSEHQILLQNLQPEIPATSIKSGTFLSTSLILNLPEIPNRDETLLLEWNDPAGSSNICSFFIIGGRKVTKSKKKDLGYSDCWRITFDKDEIFGESTVLRDSNVHCDSNSEWATPTLKNRKILKNFKVKKEKDLPFSIYSHKGCVRRTFKPELWIFGGNSKKLKNNFLVFSEDSWHIVKPTTPGPMSFKCGFTIEYRQKTNTIIFYGGKHKDTYLNEIWEFSIKKEMWRKMSSDAEDSESSSIEHPNQDESEHRTQRIEQPRGIHPTTCILLGNDLLLVHEFCEENAGILFIYNLEMDTWRKLRVEGCPPDSYSSYILIRNTPRRFLMIGEDVYSLEVLQNLKKIRHLSEELQRQIATKDVLFQLVDSSEQAVDSEDLVSPYRGQRENSHFSTNSKDNQSILCHKVILMQSPVLLDKIKNAIQPTSHQQQQITNVTLSCPKHLFELVVQYLYGSHPNLTIENVIPLMTQAQALKLDQLRDYCLQRILSILDVDNIIDYILQAYENNLESLIIICLRYIYKYYEELIENDPKFEKLPSTILYKLMRIRESIETLPEIPSNMNTVTNPLNVLQKHIHKIKKGGYLHDFVFRSYDGRSFKVHQAILSVRSPYFLQLIKESKTSKYVFNGTTSEISVNGKFLNIILEELYGLFIPSEGTPASRALSIIEMMEFTNVCLHMNLLSLADSILYQLSDAVDEQHAIQVLEFSVRIKSEYWNASQLQNVSRLKEASMESIRKPETDFEYGLMMSKFFEAKIELSDEKRGSPNSSRVWSEIFKFPGDRMVRSPDRQENPRSDNNRKTPRNESPLVKGSNRRSELRNKPSSELRNELRSELRNEIIRDTPSRNLRHTHRSMNNSYNNSSNIDTDHRYRRNENSPGNLLENSPLEYKQGRSRSNRDIIGYTLDDEEENVTEQPKSSDTHRRSDRYVSHETKERRRVSRLKNEDTDDLEDYSRIKRSPYNDEMNYNVRSSRLLHDNEENDIYSKEKYLTRPNIASYLKNSSENENSPQEQLIHERSSNRRIPEPVLSKSSDDGLEYSATRDSTTSPPRHEDHESGVDTETYSVRSTSQLSQLSHPSQSSLFSQPSLRYMTRDYKDNY